MHIKFSNLSETDFIDKYLLLYNLSVDPEFRLVKSEMELITEFALLPPKFEHSRFSSLGKDKVIDILSKRGDKTVTKASVNSKIYDILSKGFFYRDEDKVIYMPKHLLKAVDTYKKDKKFTVTISLNADN